MQKIAQWYEEKLGFHRFWTADDKDISTEFTSLRSIVVANDNERIKMPITGKVHQPPPVHQTFEGPGFVICSFVPRLFDYHEKAIPAPYAHSNVETDEVAVMLDTFNQLHITEEAMQLDDPRYPFSWLEDK